MCVALYDCCVNNSALFLPLIHLLSVSANSSPDTASTDSTVSPSHHPAVSVKPPRLRPKSPPPIQPKPSVKRPTLAPKPPNLVVVTADNGERRRTIYSDIEVKSANNAGVRESSLEEVAYVTV